MSIELMKEILDNKEKGLKQLAKAQKEVDKVTAARDEIAEKFGIPLDLGNSVKFFPEKFAEVREFMDEHSINVYQEDTEYYELEPSEDQIAIIESFMEEFEEFLWDENWDSGYWALSSC